ncbi:MAG: ImmA/IrrE family metallo-endopeptidase [Faecalibacterium sp.]
MTNKILLDAVTINAIKIAKDTRWSKDNLATRYPNPILKDDVLRLLGEYCTIIYFPLENERNHGFHINGLLDKNGNSREFVFINTAQTIEKQVFTAAHELGHIWNISEDVISSCNLTYSDELDDAITNMFAAKLLMPTELFKLSWEHTCDHLHFLSLDDPQNIFETFLQLIASLMNEYCAPYKAIVYRCDELNLIPRSLASSLLNDTNAKLKAYVQEALHHIFTEQGYTRFLTSDNRKHIQDFSELLDSAESKASISLRKIQKMREMFELPTSSNPHDITPEIQTQLHEFIDSHRDKDVLHDS